ncbi:MAG: hypothetical protein HOM68_01345 [Gemmatimonadetes bacterium]|nr:hypothetical protein [Gemmatimonadota bacterium]MBT5055156.1 hypothetical protein [Gemmatimonadota bacterium]MBT5146562.1 hypothetical protein [Gemmatimonadota bacterium]MBT5591483.1 hypothetical protein [Gemmatimonadota bacterium]MBT5962062.1 hypothetical protein [Gemmatimonadota bacterium]
MGHSTSPQTRYTYVANRPFSDPQAPDLHMAAAHNVFRGEDYPAYHRMDVRFNREGGFIYFRDDTSWFGRLPVLGVSWEFQGNVFFLQTNQGFDVLYLQAAFL